MEILNYGIGGPNLAGGICADPTPNAILRIQRLRDNSGTCNYAGSTDAWNHWPNTLFDMRGGLQRDVVPAHTNVLLGGVMHYIALDVRNLSLWFQGAGAFAGGTGNTANNDGGAGYSVYFSDRRNNRNQLESGDRRIRLGGLRQSREPHGHPERDAGHGRGCERRRRAPGLRRRAELQRRLQQRGGRVECAAHHRSGPDHPAGPAGGEAESGDPLPPCPEARQRRSGQPRDARAHGGHRESRVRPGRLQRQRGRASATRTPRRPSSPTP